MNPSSAIALVSATLGGAASVAACERFAFRSADAKMTRHFARIGNLKSIFIPWATGGRFELGCGRGMTSARHFVRHSTAFQQKRVDLDLWAGYRSVIDERLVSFRGR